MSSDILKTCKQTFSRHIFSPRNRDSTVCTGLVYFVSLKKLTEFIKWGLKLGRTQSWENISVCAKKKNLTSQDQKWVLWTVTGSQPLQYVYHSQSVEHRTGITEVMGSNPVETSEFFLGFICNCLSYFTTAKISFTSILYPQFTHMIFIIYTSHHSCFGCCCR